MQIPSVFAAVYMRNPQRRVPTYGAATRRRLRQMENFPSLHAVSLFKKRQCSPMQIYGAAMLYRRPR
jgi:hypothetical protein